MPDAWVLIGLWVLLAFVMATIPSRDNHWRRAYVLIAVGLPMLVLIVWRDGVWMGLLALVVAASVLRWPVWYGWQWIKRKLGRG